MDDYERDQFIDDPKTAFTPVAASQYRGDPRAAAAKLWETVYQLQMQLRALHTFGAEAIAAPLSTRVQAVNEAIGQAASMLDGYERLQGERDRLADACRVATERAYDRDQLDLANNRLNAEAYQLRLENFKQGHVIAFVYDRLRDLVKAKTLPRGAAQRIFDAADDYAAAQVLRIAEDQSVSEETENDGPPA